MSLGLRVSFSCLFSVLLALDTRGRLGGHVESACDEFEDEGGIVLDVAVLIYTVLTNLNEN